MKKTLCLILLCTMLLCPLCAFGEETPAETMDFGDFTMTLNPETPGHLYEKTDNSVFLILYPLYLETGDESSILNVVWGKSRATDGQMQSQEYLDALWEGIKEQLTTTCEQMGLNLLEINFLEKGFTQVGGLNALYYTYYSTMDYSDFSDETQGVVMGIYTKGIIVCGGFGTYTFTCTSSEQEAFATCFDPLLATVQWN